MHAINTSVSDYSNLCQSMPHPALKLSVSHNPILVQNASARQIPDITEETNWTPIDSHTTQMKRHRYHQHINTVWGMKTPTD